jgi:hypothetical protein
VTRAASVGGLFHFKPNVPCRLLALSRHCGCRNECPLSGGGGGGGGLGTPLAFAKKLFHMVWIPPRKLLES